MRPFRLAQDEEDTTQYVCYFCDTPVPECGHNEAGDIVVAPGIIWYRVKYRRGGWSAESVCELCWRVAEQVSGWYE